MVSICVPTFSEIWHKVKKLEPLQIPALYPVNEMDETA